MRREDLCGYVLSGGVSSRMGQDKAFLELEGKPLVQRAVEVLQPVCGDVKILAGSDEARIEQLRKFGDAIADIHPGCGPLGGMEAALADTSLPWVMVLAIDTPFIPVKMLEDWRESTEEESAVLSFCVLEGDAQPLPVMMYKGLLPHISGALDSGNYKVSAALEKAALSVGRRIDLFDVERVRCDGGPSRRSWFANINTPLEWDEASLRLRQS